MSTTAPPFVEKYVLCLLINVFAKTVFVIMITLLTKYLLKNFILDLVISDCKVLVRFIKLKTQFNVIKCHCQLYCFILKIFKILSMKVLGSKSEYFMIFLVLLKLAGITSISNFWNQRCRNLVVRLKQNDLRSEYYSTSVCRSSNFITFRL